MVTASAPLACPMSESNLDQLIRLRRFSVAMLMLITVLLLGVAVATLYVDVPKAITLMFGLAAGFCLGSLLAVWYVQGALNAILHH